MTSPSLAQLAHVGSRDERAHVEDARDSLAATLAWMTATIASRQDSLAFAPRAGATSGGAADSWRASAGPMTPARVTSDEAAAPDGRIVAQVQTEALGPIRLVVERTKSGVSVVVGVRDEAALAAIETHRAGLEQALVAAGLSVASVTVARIGDDGTDLAHVGAGSANAADSQEVGSSEESPARQTGKRRLNTLG